jgi:hypothetical protein
MDGPWITTDGGGSARGFPRSGDLSECNDVYCHVIGASQGEAMKRVIAIHHALPHQ